MAAIHGINEPVSSSKQSKAQARGKQSITDTDEKVTLLDRATSKLCRNLLFKIPRFPTAIRIYTPLKVIDLIRWSGKKRMYEEIG